jgi:hypothetical protein
VIFFNIFSKNWVLLAFMALNIKLKHKTLRGEVLRESLKKLTFRDGFMIEVLRRKLPAYGKVVLVMNADTDKIIAWGVVSKVKNIYGWHPIPMVFVHQHCRKQGLAKIVLKELMLNFKRIYFDKNTIYNIPKSKRNIVYYDRLNLLFEKILKKSGFFPVKLTWKKSDL